MQDAKDLETILSAKAANGVGNSLYVEDFDVVVLELATASSAALVVKFQGSVSDTAPTFSSAQSATNHWDYIEVVDLQNGTGINGDTGITLAGTDDFRILEVNVNGLKWINAIVSGYSAGTITLKAKKIKRD